MYDFEVEVPTRTGWGGGGRDRYATGGAYGRLPPLTNYRFLGIDESSSSAIGRCELLRSLTLGS
jgi:hypothetical protein